ncbi:endonuclease Q family protein, partial [Candidatus Microgenomates bacterium]|nr:endonuclease Q family protein [Candidatus Microgenomates bacterium]
VCGKKLTIGVMHRVEQLAGKTENELRINPSTALKTGNQGLEKRVKMISSEAFPDRPPYVMLVPLQEILSEALGGMPTGQVVQNEYKKLTDGFGGEFEVLLNTDIKKIKNISGERVGEAIEKVRNNDMAVDPGYDGVFGKVKIWKEVEKEDKKAETKEQMSLF